MPDPTRFAGYDSPRQLAEDPALSREHKISALLAWHAALQRADSRGRTRYARLSVELHEALRELRGARD
jgi:hypothetical protein